jgi:hypothetical protein
MVKLIHYWTDRRTVYFFSGSVPGVVVCYTVRFG